jgi:hypothetical protein
MENKPDLRANKLHDDVVKELSIKIKEIKLWKEYTQKNKKNIATIQAV